MDNQFAKEDIKIIKGISILFLLFLHLFNTKDYENLFSPLFFINKVPLVYYLSLVSGACVPMFLFCSGYGLVKSEEKKQLGFNKNIKRIFKLLINYWIVLILFVVLGYLLGYKSDYPGDIKKFLLNFLLLSKSYNGAWWFLQTYVLLILVFKKFSEIIAKNNKIVIILISGVIYFLTFIQNIKGIIDIEIYGGIIETILIATINFLYCQFSFVMGIITAKERIIENLRSKTNKLKYRQMISYCVILGVFLLNVMIENYIIDPITAIVLIYALSIVKIPEALKSILLYLSDHSTNIWLTHMFFYMIFFKEIIYYPKNPIFIFLWLLLICLAFSYVINYIYNFVLNKISQIIEKKFYLIFKREV